MKLTIDGRCIEALPGVSLLELIRTQGGMVLDCETERAYAMGDVGQGLDGDIYAPVFPELTPGANRIFFSGGVSAVQIIPRWWEL